MSLKGAKAERPFTGTVIAWSSDCSWWEADDPSSLVSDRDRTGDAPSDIFVALAGVAGRHTRGPARSPAKNAGDAARRGVALQLFGHTYGGMIRGLDRIIALVNGGYVSGRNRVGNLTLYVRSGTALWPSFALPLGPQPEITRITLRRRPDAAITL